MTKTILCVALLGLTSSLAGCGDSDDPEGNPPPPEQGALEIEGTWTSNFDTTEIIESDTWTTLGETAEGEAFTSETRIDSYSNDENEVITQNADDDEYSPSLYNRIVYTEIDGDGFYYCITDFGVASSADAQARNTVADDSDPDSGGCGQANFPWTKLTRD
jgi:hypothetical protein